MNRLLLMLASKPNLRLMEDALAGRYPIFRFDEARYQGVLRACDLIVVDGVMLERYMDAIVTARNESLPVFLPVLLVTSRQNVGLATRNLWKSIDEVILTPIERVELQARVEVMLRMRRLSTELYQRNQDMEAFVHAVTHELRAPLRAMAGFAEAILEDTSLPDNSEAINHLQRIIHASQDMRRVLDSLLTFARLGREVQVQTVYLQPLVDSCLRELEKEIASTMAQITYEIEWDTVEADPLLLKIVIQNLVSNALKFCDKSRRLQIRIRAYRRGEFCRIEVQDNGIGMLPEEVERVFSPFVRLHGAEAYAGVGLGLSIVRKAVTAMGGRCGALSAPDEGSMFWVELPLVEGASDEGTAAGR